MTRILGIDPGTSQSGWLLYDSAERRVVQHGITANVSLLEVLRASGRLHARENAERVSLAALGRTPPAFTIDVAAIERFASYGMPVGQEVFDTVWWTGRFTEALHPVPHVMLFRKTVASALCGSAKAKDGNVRQALLDRFGGTAAKGTKARPGPLHGVSNDVWSALGLAVTLDEQGWTHPIREDRA